MRRWVAYAVGPAVSIPVGWAVSGSASLFTDSVFTLVCWVGILVAAAIGPAVLLPRHARRPTELGIIYGSIWAVVFGLASLTWIRVQEVTGFALTRDDISRSIALMAVGIACFWTGYIFVRRRNPGPSLDPRPIVVGWVAVVICYVVGIAAAVYMLRSGLIGYTLTYPASFSPLQQTLGLISLGAPIATYTAWLGALQTRSTGARTLAGVFLLGLVMLGLSAGSKWGAMEPIGFFLLIFLMYRRRVPWKWVVSAILLFLLVIVPGNLLFRGQIPATLPQQQLVGSSQIVAVTNSRLSLGQRALSAGSWLRNRLTSIDTIGLIVEQTPNPNPYQHGRLWALAPIYNVIPRIVWPSKPVLDLEYEFDRNYRHLPASAITNTGLTEPGDLYINFGLWGVALGMLVIGGALAWATREWGTVARPQRLILYLIILDQVLLIEHALSGLLLTLPRMLVVGYVVARLTMRLAPPTKASVGLDRRGWAGALPMQSTEAVP
jgi:hypothetical protein